MGDADGDVVDDVVDMDGHRRIDEPAHERRDLLGTQPVAAVVQLVECFWCERPHPGEHPLSVCSGCAARLWTMAALEMSGSYPLSDSAIDQAVGRASPGNYALGYMDRGAFRVCYVGRSQSDVRRRLHQWVDRPSRYTRYASPARAPWSVHRRGPLPVDNPALGHVEGCETPYTHFAYSYARSAQEAYAKEWLNYDTFGGSQELDNEVGPASSEA